MYGVQIGDKVRISNMQSATGFYSKEGVITNTSNTGPSDGYKDWITIQTEWGKFTWIPYLMGGQIEKLIEEG